MDHKMNDDPHSHSDNAERYPDLPKFEDMLPLELRYAIELMLKKLSDRIEASKPFVTSEIQEDYDRFDAYFEQFYTDRPSLIELAQQLWVFMRQEGIH